MILLAGFSSDVKLFPTTFRMYFRRDALAKDLRYRKARPYDVFPFFLIRSYRLTTVPLTCAFESNSSGAYRERGRTRCVPETMYASP